MTLENVTLRNGAVIPKVGVTVAMISLQNLVATNPIAFYELVQKVRNPDHRLFGNSADILRGLALLESDGQPHSMLRDIVLSAVSGDGFNMTLNNPVWQ